MTQTDQMAAGSRADSSAGALSPGEYLDRLAAAGFTDASVTVTAEAARVSVRPSGRPSRRAARRVAGLGRHRERRRVTRR